MSEVRHSSRILLLKTPLSIAGFMFVPTFGSVFAYYSPHPTVPLTLRALLISTIVSVTLLLSILILRPYVIQVYDDKILIIGKTASRHNRQIIQYTFSEIDSVESIDSFTGGQWIHIRTGERGNRNSSEWMLVLDFPERYLPDGVFEKSKSRIFKPLRLTDKTKKSKVQEDMALISHQDANVLNHTVAYSCKDIVSILIENIVFCMTSFLLVINLYWLGVTSVLLLSLVFIMSFSVSKMLVRTLCRTKKKYHIIITGEEYIEAHVRNESNVDYSASHNLDDISIHKNLIFRYVPHIDMIKIEICGGSGFQLSKTLLLRESDTESLMESFTISKI